MMAKGWAGDGEWSASSVMALPGCLCAPASHGKGAGGRGLASPSAPSCWWSVVGDCTPRSAGQDSTLGCAQWGAE